MNKQDPFDISLLSGIDEFLSGAGDDPWETDDYPVPEWVHYEREHLKSFFWPMCQQLLKTDFEIEALSLSDLVGKLPTLSKRTSDPSNTDSFLEQTKSIVYHRVDLFGDEYVENPEYFYKFIRETMPSYLDELATYLGESGRQHHATEVKNRANSWRKTFLWMKNK